MMSKKNKYIVLISIEIFLVLVTELLEKLFEISQYKIINDIGLVALAIPIIIILYLLRKEKLKPFWRILATFFLVVFSISLPLSFIASFLEESFKW